MPTRFQLIGLALAGALVWAVLGAVNRPTNVEASAPTAPIEASGRSTVDYNALHAAQHRETEDHIRALKELQVSRESRAKALAGTAETRRFLQVVYQAPWANVLATNWPAFLELRRQAAQTRTKETPCTLCDGGGYMRYCIVCPEHKGQCVTCGGSGRVAGNEVCPGCVGTGKCYLCVGSGKMACPFCSDGRIEIRRPLPGNVMPAG